MNRRDISSDEILALRVQKQTHANYFRALVLFHHWMHPHVKSPSDAKNFPFLKLSSEDLDSLLVDYFTSLFNTPNSPSYTRAKQTFFAVLFFAPHFRFSLSYSHALLKSWKKSIPAPQKAPIPWHLALLFARICSEQNMMSEALAFLILHHTYLRVNNVLKLRKSDVVADLKEVDPDFPLMILRILKTKTDPFKTVEIRRQDLADAIVAYVSRLKHGDDLLFNFSYSHLSSVLKSICRSLQLSHFGFTLHKFRHGGASHDHLKGVDFQTIKRRGIWKQDESVEIYVSTGVCFSILTSLPKEFLRIGKLLDEDLSRCFLLAETLF
jgi:integrase